jgi:hypothetical protein
MSVSSEYVCLEAAGGLTCYPLPYALVGLLLAAVVLAAALVPLLVSSRRTPTTSQAAARANRHATLGSVAGASLLVAVLGLAAVGALAAPQGWADGRVLAALPGVAGLCLVAAQALAQVTWPRPRGTHREAHLVRRRHHDVVPVATHRLLVCWAGALAAALAVLVLRADGPRTLAVTTAGTHRDVGPYPGTYYAVPLLLVATALVATCELTLRLIVLRPAVTGVTADWDLHLRRRSARHLVGGVQLALAGTLACVLALAGIAHQVLGEQVVGGALLAAAAAVAVAALAALVPRPGRRPVPALRAVAP